MRIAPVALLLLAGCLKFEASATLMPDGSGRMSVSYAVRKELDGFKTPKLTDTTLTGAFDGIDAWAEFKTGEEGDSWTVSGLAYFPDINKVRIKFADDGDAFSFELKDASLTVSDPLPTIVGRMKEKAEKVEPLQKGFRFALSITAPGPIASGDGRKATITIDDKALIEATRDRTNAAKYLPPKHVVTWGKSVVTDDEIAAFKKEHAAAKAAWDARPEAGFRKREPKAKDKRPSIAVADFADKSGFESDAAKVAGDAMVRWLTQSEQFVVSDRRTKEAMKEGKLAAVKYLVWVAITSVAISPNGPRVELEVRVVNVHSSDVVFRETAEGRAKRGVERAAEDALAKTFDKLVDALGE